MNGIELQDREFFAAIRDKPRAERQRRAVPAGDADPGPPREKPEKPFLTVPVVTISKPKRADLMRRHPALPYTLPFVVFIALLALNQVVMVPAWLRFTLSMAAILAVSRPALTGRPSRPLQSILLGIAVFAIWVGPDFLFPSWHHFFLFDNGVVGHPAGNTPPALKNDPVFFLTSGF